MPNYDLLRNEKPVSVLSEAAFQSFVAKKSFAVFRQLSPFAAVFPYKVPS